MIHTISISPFDGDYGFNIKYDEDTISIPGYKCSQGDEEALFEMSVILQEDLGCSEEQVKQIFQFVYNEEDGLIDSQGFVIY